jgi:hypothetical protein
MYPPTNAPFSRLIRPCSGAHSCGKLISLHKPDHLLENTLLPLSMKPILTFLHSYVQFFSKMAAEWHEINAPGLPAPDPAGISH